MAGSSKKVLGEEIAAMFEDDNFLKTLVNLIRVELEEKLAASLYCRKAEIGELFKELVSPPNEENKVMERNDIEEGKLEEEGENKDKREETKEGKVKLSPELAALVGQNFLSQLEAARKIAEIIEEKGLRDPQDGKYVICDDALMKVIGVERFEAVNTMNYLKNQFINEVSQTPTISVASTSEGSSSAGTPMITKDVNELFGVISKEDLRREIAAIRNERSEEQFRTGLASPNTVAPNELAPNEAAPNMKKSNISVPNTSARNMTELNIAALNKAARKISERNKATRNIVAPNKVAPNTGPLNIVVPKTVVPITLPPIILPINTTASNIASSNMVSTNAVVPYSVMTPNTVAPSTVAPNTLALNTLALNTEAPNSNSVILATPNMGTSTTVVAPTIMASNLPVPNITAPSLTAPNTNEGDAEVPEMKPASASPCCHVT